MSNAFGTVVTCIDGRTLEPVIAWMKEHFGVGYVDTITFPGLDDLLAHPHDRLEEMIRKSVEISAGAHHSHVIAVAGHAECAGNPVPVAEHERDIRLAVERVRAWKLPIREVVGLFLEQDAGGGPWNVRRVL